MGNPSVFYSQDSGGNNGGAIYNISNLPSAHIYADFFKNTTTGDGGAIRNSSAIGTIIGDFIANTANGDGGAIRNASSIGNIAGDFIANTTTAGDGGAIQNGNSMGNITGDFIANTAGRDGGAIFSGGLSMGIINANFINNTANTRGGAIYTKLDLTFLADTQINVFSGNKDSQGSNAIHVYAGSHRTLNFTMTGNGGFLMNDGISAENNTYTVAISGANTNNVFYLNNSIDNTGSVTLHNATLNFGSVTQNGRTYNGSVQNLSTTGTSIISGNAVINGTATFNGTTSFNGTTNFANPATFTNGSTANFNQAITFNNANKTPTFQAGSTANFNENVTFTEAVSLANASFASGKTANFNDTSSFSGNVAFNGTTNFANTTTFTSGSVLLVDANAFTSKSALNGTNTALIVESGAKLQIANGTNGDIVRIAEGFINPASSIATGAWDGANLTSTSSLQVAKVADFDPTIGTYSITITGNSSGGIRQDYPMAQEPTIDSMTNVGHVADVNSSRESIRFFSTLADNIKGIGTNNPRQTVQVWESALQMATSGASAFMGMGASYGAANTILAHLSQSGFGSGSTTGGESPAVVQVSENASGLNSGSDMADHTIKNGLALWLSPMYKYSTVQGVDAGAFKHGYDTSMSGLALGADYTVNNAFRFGLAFNLGTGYAQSTGDLSQTQNNFDFWGLSLYGAYYKNDFSLMADVGFTSVFGEISQDVPAILGSSSLEAHTQSTVWTAGLTAEYTFKTDFMNITPHAGLRYMHVYTGAYDTENNRGVVGETESDSQGVWYFPVGVTFSKDFESVSGWTFTPKLDVGFIAAAGDLEANSVSSIPGVAGNAEYTMQNVDGFVRGAPHS